MTLVSQISRTNVEYPEASIPWPVRSDEAAQIDMLHTAGLAWPDGRNVEPLNIVNELLESD